MALSSFLLVVFMDSISAESRGTFGLESQLYFLWGFCSCIQTIILSMRYIGSGSLFCPQVFIGTSDKDGFGP